VELNHNATSGVVAWDGERFAIVTYDMDSHTTFAVDIATADGLQFSGRYHSSLPELYGEILDYGMEYDQYGFATLFPLTAAWGGQS